MKLLQHIQMSRYLSNVSGTANTYNTIQSIRAKFDRSKFDGTVETYFEICLRNTAGAGTTAYAQLYNVTDGVVVSGSEVSTGPNSYPQRFRSGNLNLSGDKEYVVQTKHTTSSTSATVANAKIIVSQEGTITKTQIHIELGAELSTTSTTATNTVAGFGSWIYDAAKWDGIVSVHHEAVLRAVSGNTALSDIFDRTTGANVPSSVALVQTTSTQHNVQRSSDFSLTDGHEYKPTLYVSGGTSALFESNKIVITLEDFTKFVAYWESSANIGSGASNSTNVHPNYNVLVDGYTHWDPADFEGFDIVHRYEAQISTTNAGNVAYSDLEDYVYATSANSIADTEVSITGTTTADTITSQEFLLTDPIDVVGGVSGNASSIGRLYQSKLVIEATVTEAGETLDTDFIEFTFSAPSATRTHGTDALKRAATTKTHTTDSLKRESFIRTHTTDALKHIAEILTHTTDALKRVSFNITHTADALKRAALTRSHTTNANKKRGYEVAHTADANKRRTYTVDHTTSAFKRTAFTRTHSTDSNKKRGHERSHTTDALLRSAHILTHTLDALKRKAFELLHTTSANKRKATERNHTTDTLKRQIFTRSHTTDALKRTANILTHSTNALLRAAIAIVHTTDALILTAEQKVHSTDANKRKALEKWHTTDTNRKQGYTVQHTTSANKRRAYEIFHSTSTLLREALSRSHTTDANKRRVTEQSHTTDTLKRTVNIIGHVTDALLRTANILTHSTNSLKNRGKEEFHTTNALKRKAFELTHTTNTLIRKGFEIAHLTDALKRKEELRQHTTDALKRLSLGVSHITDSLLRQAQQAVHTTDSLIRKLFERSHTTDTLKRDVETISHSTDANKKIADNQLLHSTDALKARAETIAHTTDSNKRLGIEVHHTTDAIKLAVQVISHSTDSMISNRFQNRIYINLDAEPNELDLESYGPEFAIDGSAEGVSISEASNEITLDDIERAVI